MIVNLRNVTGPVLLLTFLMSCQSHNSVNQDMVKNDSKKEGIALEASKTLSKEDKVFFDFDSSDLTKKTKNKLKQQAIWMNNNPSKNFLIQGYTDERGNKDYNLALGKRRSLSVKKFLINEGVSAQRLEIISYGEDKPAAIGIGSKNRRAVTIRLKK